MAVVADSVAEQNFAMQSNGVGESPSEKKKVEFVADREQEAAANTHFGEVQHEEQLLLSGDGALLPSSKHADAVKEPEGSMGETAAGEENSKVHQQVRMSVILLTCYIKRQTVLRACMRHAACALVSAALYVNR